MELVIEMNTNLPPILILITDFKLINPNSDTTAPTSRTGQFVFDNQLNDSIINISAGEEAKQKFQSILMILMTLV